MPAQTDPRILIVDDNAPLRAVIVRVIQKIAADAAIVEVERVAPAIEALQKERFTALIVDYHLPDGYGIEIVRWARAHCADLLIVATSGLHVEREMHAVGAHYCLDKPFDIDRLMLILRIILETSDAASQPT